MIVRKKHPQKVFDHTSFKDMWNWVANNPASYWSSWSGFGDLSVIEEETLQDFPCQACDQRCQDCPINWPNNAKCSQFFAWYDLYSLLDFVSKTEESREENYKIFPELIQTARLIRDLPIKDSWKKHTI